MPNILFKKQEVLLICHISVFRITFNFTLYHAMILFMKRMLKKIKIYLENGMISKSKHSYIIAHSLVFYILHLFFTNFH